MADFLKTQSCLKGIVFCFFNQNRFVRSEAIKSQVVYKVGSAVGTASCVIYLISIKGKSTKEREDREKGDNMTS